MTKTLYLGVRVEVASRFFSAEKVKQYNKKHRKTRVLDVHKGGRITVEKTDKMLIARGAKDERGDTGLVNFSVMAKVKDLEQITRVVKIVNVLGNDKLIRERVKTFVDGRSILSAIPELYKITPVFESLDIMMPGLVMASWYYAPEAILK